MNHPEDERHDRGVDRRLMRRLLGYLAPYRGDVALAVVVALGDAVVQLAGPYLTKQAIDLMPDASRETGIMIERLAYGMLAQSDDAKRLADEWSKG